MGDGDVPDGSLYFGQRENVLHKLAHFRPGQLLYLRGKALHGAAQIAEAVGTFDALALFVILQAVFKPLFLVALLRKLGFLFLNLRLELVDCFCHFA